MGLLNAAHSKPMSTFNIEAQPQTASEKILKFGSSIVVPASKTRNITKFGCLMLATAPLLLIVFATPPSHLAAARASTF